MQQFIPSIPLIFLVGVSVIGCVGPARAVRTGASAGRIEGQDSKTRIVTLGSRNPPVASQQAKSSNASQPSQAASGSADAEGKRTSPPKAADAADELNQVLSQLSDNSDLDPRIRERLREGLKEEDPTVQRLLARQIRATINRRQQIQESSAGTDSSRHESPGQLSKPNDHVSSPSPRLSTFSDPVSGSSDQDARSSENASPRRSGIAHPDAPMNPLRSSSEPGDQQQSTDLTRDDDRATADNEKADETQHTASDQSHGNALTSSVVQVASEVSVDTTSWRDHMKRAIDVLQKQQAERTSDTEVDMRDAAYLRLLYLVDEDTSNAVQAIEGLESADQEFWKHQLLGLAMYLDRDGMPVHNRRVAVALRELRDATAHLAVASALDVRGLAFCTTVDSFGVYTEFDANEFVSDQEVLLYVEIDNFSSKQTPQGYMTSLEGSYQIFDAAGRRVADHTFTAEQESCRNRRRDYFIPYRMWMPKKVYPGTYTLQLTIEDTQAQKFGQSSIQFSIKP